MAATTHFGRNQPYRPVSVAGIGCIGMFRWPFRLESAISACFDGRLGRINSLFCQNRPFLAQINANQAELVGIKKKGGGGGRIGASDAGRRVGLRQCFLAFNKSMR